MTNLKPKQEKFCLEFAKTGNATTAYLRAGYSVTDEVVAASNASRLLRNAKVQARLKEITEEISSAKVMNAREISERLTAIARGEVSEEIILSGGDRSQKQASIRDQLKAIEMLAKIQGLFVIKQDVDVNLTPIVISGGDCLED